MSACARSLFYYFIQCQGTCNNLPKSTFKRVAVYLKLRKWLILASSTTATTNNLPTGRRRQYRSNSVQKTPPDGSSLGVYKITSPRGVVGNTVPKVSRKHNPTAHPRQSLETLLFVGVPKIPLDGCPKNTPNISSIYSNLRQPCDVFLFIF